MTKRYIYIRQQSWSRLKFCNYLLSLALKCESAVELGLREFISAENKTYECSQSVCSWFLQILGLTSYPKGFHDSLLNEHHSFDSSVEFTSLLPTNDQQVKMLNRNQFKAAAEVIISFTNMIHSILSEV